MTADGTAYLLKLFSAVRYQENKLDRIEAAMQRQKHLYQCGIPCPRVFSASDGSVIRRIPTPLGVDIAYMLMTFEDGCIPTDETVTAAQMTAIGDACARMHNALETLDAAEDHCCPLSSASVVQRLCDHRRSLDSLTDYSPPAGIDPILASLDTAFFDRQKRQLCHEDLSADNLLVSGDGVMILDFDRGQYSFPLHDVGRILLSLAFDSRCLRAPLVKAFRDGYRRHRPLSEQEIADALRITFACEFPWWIHPDYERMTQPKIYRFVHEMYYLIKNWDNIPNIIPGG